MKPNKAELRRIYDGMTEKEKEVYRPVSREESDAFTARIYEGSFMLRNMDFLKSKICP